MKCVILAGGLGSRLAEETTVKPKPMVQIGERPILWHIMKIYSHFGIREFIICAGYKGYVIKEFFANYFLHTSDITFDISSGDTLVHRSNSEPWKVTVVDTGVSTMTGGRLKQIARYLDGEDFCMTYGDGVANIDIDSLMKFHRSHGKLCTVSATRPPGRFGALEIKGDKVSRFVEKPLGDGGFINGGFFVMSPRCLDYIKDDQTTFEQEPMTRLAQDGEMQAFKHEGFWQPMDTIRDRKYLEELWATGKAPWKVWEE